MPSSFNTASRLVLITLGFMIAYASPVFAERPYVVGYMPAYKDIRATADATDMTKLTHINISFFNPDADGQFMRNGEPACMDGASVADLDYVVQRAHKAGAKVLVAIAGGVIPPCGGDWSHLLKPAQRQAVIDQLVQFVEDHQLDGIDVDIEGALLTKIDEEGNYTPFVAQLRSALNGKLLTAATATYDGGMIPVSSLPYFDFVTLMSYDAIGPSWGPAGAEHSSYAVAEEHVATWRERGLTADKLVLGLPFYGYGFGKYAAEYYTFDDLISQFGRTIAQGDLIGEACAGCDYITYNGIPTLQKKVALGLREGAGVMIWEMSQDTQGSLNLLNVVHRSIQDQPGDGEGRGEGM
jgi:chitinase